jgi:hypothetical protein
VSVCVFNVDIVEESKRIHSLQEIENKKASRQGKHWVFHTCIKTGFFFEEIKDSQQDEEVQN